MRSKLTGHIFVF